MTFLNLGLHMKVVGLCLTKSVQQIKVIWTSRTRDMTQLPNSVPISILKLINQSFHLCDRPAFKMNIYHKLKVSYIIRYML